jgi:type II secretory pathway component PulJ
MTLIEVLVATAISTVVMVAAYSFFSFGGRAAARNEARSGSVDAFSSAVVQLFEKARYAETITSPAVGRSEGMLEFSSFDKGAWRVQVEDKNLVLQEAHGSQKEVLARGVHAVKFRRENSPGPHVLEVTLTRGEGELAKEARTVLYLRGTRR